jgi:tetratricopeptide (TPR) repeat protein
MERFYRIETDNGAMSHAVVLAFVLSLGAAPVGQQQLTPAQHASAGWEALKAGRYEDAAAAFDLALRAEPRDASLLFAAGLAANMRGQSDIARRYLFDALKYDPKLSQASILLSNILYRENDIDGAIAVLEQALVHQPDSKPILSRLEGWRKEAELHGRFGQKLGDHFTVLFEGPAEADLAQKAVAILEAAYWRIGGALATYPMGVITVVLYTREQFRDVTQSPEWAGGLYDGRIRMPVRGALENLREFERVLTHEFTHALIHTLAPNGVPLWLGEGLAVNFEGSDLNVPLAELKKTDSRPALTQLEGSFRSLDTKAAKVAYAQSAIAVQRLLQEAGASSVVGILTEIGRGTSFPEAFQRHTGMSYEEFQKRLDGVV